MPVHDRVCSLCVSKAQSQKDSELIPLGEAPVACWNRASMHPVAGLWRSREGDSEGAFKAFIKAPV